MTQHGKAKLYRKQFLFDSRKATQEGRPAKETENDFQQRPDSEARGGIQPKRVHLPGPAIWTSREPAAVRDTNKDLGKSQESMTTRSKNKRK